jgi:hypothetical protein
MDRLQPPGVLNQIPVHPSHHMATVPGFTSSLSISSFSQVPHSGKVLMIHDSLDISFILLTPSPPLILMSVFYVLFIS